MEFLNPAFLDGLGTVGTWTLVGVALITGKGIALTREVKNRDLTIAWQRETILELSGTIKDLTAGNAVAARALDKVANAAMEAGTE